MKISTLGYSLKQGLKSIRRNKLFSLASIATIAACIFLLGLFYSIIVNFQHLVEEAEDTVCVTVFFAEGLEEDEIVSIGDDIGKRAEVSEMIFTSADQAWEEFQKDYFGDNPDLAAGFKDDNPLADSANYQVYLNDISMQSALVTYIESIDGVRQVNHSEVTANTLSDFSKLVGYISAAVIIVLLLVSIFLISNTITIGITVRKEEIKIMKLIGATDFFVRSPFMVEGIIIGILGATIPLVGLYFIYSSVVGYVISQFQTISSSFSFLPVNDVFSVMIPMALIIGAGIGFIGSRITLRKHLHV